jgi:DNA polymerase-3 subunit epsilon
MNKEDWKFWKSDKNYPEFWRAYSARLKASSKTPTYLVFDCETTGLNPSKDVILSIGGVEIKENRIQVSTSFEHFLKQDYFDEASVKIHGIVQSSEAISYLSEEEAIKDFLALASNAILVGHHVGFDIAMVNQALNRMGLPSLRNKSIDTNRLHQQKYNLPDDVILGLDDLCETFSISKKSRHTALGDAYLTALVFQRLQKL